MFKFKFKVGDKVRRIFIPNGGVAIGDIGTVTGLRQAGSCGEGTLDVGSPTAFHDFERLELVAYAKPSKAQRLIAAKEAELARLKEAAAKRAKLAAERKAKADRAKVLAGLSAAGKRVVAMLQAGAASDFGCQRDNVILLAAAITGDKADAIKKALA